MTKTLSSLVRENIKNLTPYSSARDEYTGHDGIFLDANENPFGELNRYPDPYQFALKQELAKIKKVDAANIFLGNGSDEIIDLMYRIFCRPGIDKAYTFSPTYGMYKVAAEINDVTLIEIPLDENFQPEFNHLAGFFDSPEAKLLFVCSPNNPTGNALQGISQLIELFPGVIVIDEAYADFSGKENMIATALKNQRVLVMQTLSKAWGLAGIRIGAAYGSANMISLLNKVKPPYNISKLNQDAALVALQNEAAFHEQKNEILAQKKVLVEGLNKLKIVEHIYPSDANFLLVKFHNANLVYNTLVAEKIITRNRNSVVKNCVRITVGTEIEICSLLAALADIANNDQHHKNTTE